MADTPRKYTGAAIDVTFSARLCIHAAECVRRLNAVFDRSERPWVKPDAAPAEQIVNVIQRCPSGALQYIRHDGGPVEAIPAENTIRLNAKGPLYVRGEITIQAEDGQIIAQGTRFALCRCGQSEHKPFCDNRHRTVEFNAPGDLMDEARRAESQTLEDAGGPLTITVISNEPYLISGNFAIMNDRRETVFCATDAAFCRCGGSQDKPFCDGTHQRIGIKD